MPAKKNFVVERVGVLGGYIAFVLVIPKSCYLASRNARRIGVSGKCKWFLSGHNLKLVLDYVESFQQHETQWSEIKIHASPKPLTKCVVPGYFVQ